MKKVITYGTYDLFHNGHYNLLKRAKELGDYLIVGVTTEHYDETRGKVNVVDSLMTRIENVRSTGFADEIIVEDHVGQKIEDIQKYDVDIFTLGSDWVGTFDYLKQFCEVVYLDRTPDVSSTQIRNNNFKIINLGIVGTGRIVPRFLSEVKYVSGVNVICTFNPEVKEDKFLKKRYVLDNYYESYDEFLDEVDAIYIASPNETHYEYAKKSLYAGKHVLCEKPLCFNRDEAEELYDYAKEHELVLMEAIKTAYCPGFQQLMNVASSGVIGDVRDVEAAYTRLAEPNSRERSFNIYEGSFLEFGSYTLLPAIKLLGKEYKDIRFKTLYDDKGVDIYTKTELEYDNGMATSKNGVAVKSEGNLVISGTKGYILAPSPWWMTKHFEVHFEDPSKVDIYEPSFQGDGFRYEISEFVLKVNGSGRNSYKYTAGEAVVMAEIIEKYMKHRKGD